MRRWKKILSASLVAVMVGSLGMTAFAEDTSVNEPIDTTVSNYNLTEEETSGKNQEEIKALLLQGFNFFLIFSGRNFRKKSIRQ